MMFQSFSIWALLLLLVPASATQQFETYEELREACGKYNDPDIVEKYGPVGEWKFSSSITDFSRLFWKNTEFNEE